MKTLIGLSFLVFAVVGCWILLRRGRLTLPRNIASTTRQRPALDFMGPYNIPRTAVPNYVDEFWAESDDIANLTSDEFYNVRLDVVAALSKHGIVSGGVGDDYDFFVYDDKFFDRTQKVELNSSERLPNLLAPAVAELQESLKKHPTWRVFFIGHGLESQSKDQFFVVYPDAIRILQLDNTKSVDDAVTANARLRVAHNAERIEHRRRRVSELTAAIQAAFVNMDSSGLENVLVVWFDSLSALSWDWGWEGKAGMSAWVLLRQPISGESEDYLQSDSEFSTYWASPDGSISTDDDARKSDSRQLIHFESNQAWQDELIFRLDGKQHRYKRPTRAK